MLIKDAHWCSTRFHGQDVPPVLDPFSTQRTVPDHGSTKVKYSFWDTSSTDDRLRSMAYPDTDAFLVCYDLTSPESYGNAISKWLPEVKGGRKSGRQMIPVLFIGTKRDLLPPVEQDGWDQDGWDRRHNVEDMLKAQPYRQGTVSGWEKRGITWRHLDPFLPPWQRHKLSPNADTLPCRLHHFAHERI